MKHFLGHPPLLKYDIIISLLNAQNRYNTVWIREYWINKNICCIKVLNFCPFMRQFGKQYMYLYEYISPSTGICEKHLIINRITLAFSLKGIRYNKIPVNQKTFCLNTNLYGLQKILSFNKNVEGNVFCSFLGLYKWETCLRGNVQMKNIFFKPCVLFKSLREKSFRFSITGVRRDLALGTFK